MNRPRLNSRAQRSEGGGLYFAAPSSDLEFIPSGSAVLDCVLGGGWPLGRMSNIVGDKSTGKTLLAIEATANFCRVYPKGKPRYREAEAAFDMAYAGSLGMPIDRIDFGDKNVPFDTVEDFFEDLTAYLEGLNGAPGLYIVDSLDALSDREEMKRKIDEGSYGTGKAKKLGELFRRHVRQIERSNVHLMIISQVRDRIGVTFGEKLMRTGGHAMDFYASQALWLQHIEQLKRTVNKVTRPVGVKIRARCKKNKVGLPLRECEMDIRFGFGIDDLAAAVDFLISVNRVDDLIGKAKPSTYLNSCWNLPDDEFREEVDRAGVLARKIWTEVETTFLPGRRKY